MGRVKAAIRSKAWKNTQADGPFVFDRWQFMMRRGSFRGGEIAATSASARREVGGGRRRAAPGSAIELSDAYSF
jgi:hypothetical protein